MSKDVHGSPVQLRTGQPLVCLICRSETFFERPGVLHSAMASLFNMEWAAPKARCFVCASCGHVHWFLGT